MKEKEARAKFRQVSQTPVPHSSICPLICLVYRFTAWASNWELGLDSNVFRWNQCQCSHWMGSVVCAQSQLCLSGSIKKTGGKGQMKSWCSPKVIWDVTWTKLMSIWLIVVNLKHIFPLWLRPNKKQPNWRGDYTAIYSFIHFFICNCVELLVKEVCGNVAPSLSAIGMICCTDIMWNCLLFLDVCFSFCFLRLCQQYTTVIRRTLFTETWRWLHTRW